MREILFKAKRLDNGEWVEGYYAIAQDRRGLQQHNILLADNHFGYYKWYVINPETVCQFTGLHDKNGKKIWENDIVKDLINGDMYSCKWNHGNCEYELRNNKELFGLGYAALYNYQVIGNIFDNPELLKGGSE